MSALPRLKGDGTEPVVCGVCRRRACGFGYAPPSRGKLRPILWLCRNPQCADVAPSVYAMSEQHLDAYEERALEAAGNEAGDYLDAIGKTDLASLAPEEWTTFLSKVVTGFETSLRRQFVQGAAPF